MGDMDLAIDVDRELEELVPLFMQSRFSDLQAIDAALLTRDFATLRRIGHSIKGAAGAYGFAKVGVMGARIEDAALASDPAEILAQREAMRDYLSRVRIRFVD